MINFVPIPSFFLSSWFDKEMLYISHVNNLVGKGGEREIEGLAIASHFFTMDKLNFNFSLVEYTVFTINTNHYCSKKVASNMT